MTAALAEPREIIDSPPARKEGLILLKDGVQPVRARAANASPPTSEVGERQAWDKGLLVSLALHGAVAGALSIDWRFDKPEPAAPPAAMVVELSVLPSSPPVPPNEVAPGPEQVEAAPSPRVAEAVKFDRPPRVDAALRPQFVVPLKQEVQPTESALQAEEARATTAPKAIEAPSDRKSAAPVEGANAASPADAEQAWEGRILARLEKNKRYPSEAQRARQEDVVLVRMVLDRKGRLVGARIARSRGFASLEREVLQLTRRASPYPAPPASVAGDRIELLVPIEFFLKK